MRMGELSGRAWTSWLRVLSCTAVLWGGGPSISTVAALSSVQTGLATYLAPSFQGNEAASGERFDHRKLVAAHRTLPFGSKVRVTNLENGRSVIVRIMDRGPYGKNFRQGAIIDLSRAAARRLHMLRDGEVRVKVRVLKVGNGRRHGQKREIRG
jgi:peptidoglycan lytic transglycosylase